MLKKWFNWFLAVAIAAFSFFACEKKSPTQNVPQSHWVTYNTSNSSLASNHVPAIAIDAAGIKWFGTDYGGISRFDDTSWTTYNISNSGLACDRVWAIAIDASGNKWFGTFGSGVNKFNGSRWTTYYSGNSGIA